MPRCPLLKKWKRTVRLELLNPSVVSTNQCHALSAARSLSVHPSREDIGEVAMTIPFRRRISPEWSSSAFYAHSSATKMNLRVRHPCTNTSPGTTRRSPEKEHWSRFQRSRPSTDTRSSASSKRLHQKLWLMKCRFVLRWSRFQRERSHLHGVATMKSLSKIHTNRFTRL